MLKNIACIGDSFEGYCSACPGFVTGVLITGQFPTIDGIPICVIGDLGRGTCGHITHIVSGSTVASIEGIPIARLGDRVAGVIAGVITSGRFPRAD